jgi:hypothetical protein
MSDQPETQEPVSPHAATTYRARLRFRLQKKLNIADAKRTLTISGREVVLSAPEHTKPIRDSEWLVLNTRGFSTEAEARQFGHKLRAALEVSSAATRLGVDPGRDLPTSAVGQTVRQTAKDQFGIHLRDNVHGLDVFPDSPDTAIIDFHGTASVLAGADDFLAGLGELHDVASAMSQRAAGVVLLLNFALMRPEPVAQIVFAVSAVEMLGQDEAWSQDQKRLLEELAQAGMRSTTGSEAERCEVADAITKSLHRITLRQGVFRLLDRLGLSHLKKPWDALYSERSTLVHGLAPKPGAEYGDLASRTLNLCGQILLKAVAAEIPGADKHVSRMYPL